MDKISENAVRQIAAILCRRRAIATVRVHFIAQWIEKSPSAAKFKKFDFMVECANRWFP